MAKRRLSIRFYAFLGTVALIAIVAVILVLTDPHEGLTETGAMELSLEVSAVVVRDEVCVAGEKYGSIVFAVDEGEYVDVGARIAEAYRLGYSDDIMQAYLSVQTNILSEQLSLQEGIENVELDSMNQQITFKQRSILDAVMGSSANDLLRLESELDYLLNQRIEYLRSSVQPNEALTALYASESDRLSAFSTWRGEIVATQAGYISFYFDGYEQSLNASKLFMLSAELIRGAIKEATSCSDGTGTQFFRLYSRDHWYLAFAQSNSSYTRLIAGQTYSVIINGISASPVSCVAVSVAAGVSDTVTVLEFSSDIGDLSDIRVVSLSVTGSVNGLRVLKKAIVFKDGVAGIIVVDGDGKHRVDVNVLAADEDYAIVQAINGGSLVAGQKYSERG